MSKSEHSVRVVRDDDTSYTREAYLVQQRAADGQASVIRLGAIVFFSSATGDAWMLDVNDSTATCLARDGDPEPIPIHETATKFVIEWKSHYRIERETFVIIQPDGSMRGIIGYPTAEIQRIIDDFPAESSPSFFDVDAIRTRLKETGRNEPCPCGSGKKYKKCCEPRDEQLLRQVIRDDASATLRRAEFTPDPLEETDDDEPGEYDDVIDIDAGSEGDSAEQDDLTRDPNPVDQEEPPLDPEVERAAEASWDALETFVHPSTEQMDAHLTRLLALPPEATDWNDLFTFFALNEHADLPGVFRRIAASVSPTKVNALSFLYWSAIEKFVLMGRTDIVPEVVAKFCALDRETYDADALHQTGQWLLAAGCEAEVLALAEHFLPVLRSDTLMPYAVPDTCREIFELRVGAKLRDPVPANLDVATLTRELRREIEEEIHIDYAVRAAEVIVSRVTPTKWTRDDFKLAGTEVIEGTPTWEEALRRFEVMMHVAREASQLEQRPAGMVFRGLWLLIDAVYDERSGRPRTTVTNLLDCLKPAGMERRVAHSARGMLGTNPPVAQLLLESHGVLLSFARRHGLIEPDLAVRTERNLSMLKGKLGFVV